MKTIKKLVFFALAGCFATSCSNEDVVGNNQQAAKGNVDPMIISTPTANTRAESTMDLVNKWTVGDALGVFEEWDENCKDEFSDKGIQNARYALLASFTLGGKYYTNKFLQDGILGTPSIADPDKVGFDASLDATHFKSQYNFYSYFPYNAEATTRTAIPFTLSATQTQSEANVWTVESANYNFSWNVSKGLTRPADRIFPITPTRLMPVAEFNIVRDDASLDGYTLSSVVVKPTSGDMETGDITTPINLESVASLSTSTTHFSSTATQYELTCSNVDVDGITKNGSASVYMSLPPAASKEYTITATFSKGTDRRAISVTRKDAFEIVGGKGNIVRYYFKSSKSTNPDTPKNFKPVYTKEDYFAWDAYLYYESAPGDGKWGPTTSVYHRPAFLNINSASASCKDCASTLEMQMYLAAGVLYDLGDDTGANQQTYVLPDGKTYHRGYWLKKKAYIPGFDDLSAPMIDGEISPVVATKGRPDPSEIDKYFFVPTTGMYSNGTFKVKGSGGPMILMAWSRSCLSESSSSKPSPIMLEMGAGYTSALYCCACNSVDPDNGLVRFYAE